MVRISRSVVAGSLAALLVLERVRSSGTPYQPLSSASDVAGGYTDQKLTEGRFRVTFAGNRLTLARDGRELPAVPRR